MPHIRGDDEQEERIRRHRSHRPHAWVTIECPYNLIESVEGLPKTHNTVLIDCLSLFISNLLLSQHAVKDPYFCETSILARIHAMAALMKERTNSSFIVVTNEVGWGIVPDTSLGRA